MNIEQIRHSLAHLLAAIILEKYPGSKLGIGPTIENGFYYDFLLPSPIGQQDLFNLENKIKALIKRNIKFGKEEVTANQARELFQNQPFKLDLISELISGPANQPITVYKTFPISHAYRQASNLQPQNSVFTDLCAGPHVQSTKDIDPEAFKLTKIAGAYWRGSEKKSNAHSYLWRGF